MPAATKPRKRRVPGSTEGLNHKRARIAPESKTDNTSRAINVGTKGKPAAVKAKGKERVEELKEEKLEVGKEKKRRGVPVTNAVPVSKRKEDDSDEDDEDEDEVSESEGEGEWDGGGGESVDEFDVNEDGYVSMADGGTEDAEHGGEKPSSKDSKERHKAQKLLQNQRRLSKPYADLLKQAKRTWSLARQKNLSPSTRQTHINTLMSLIRGHIQDLVLKHDASRIVQTILKYGRAAERNEIANELKGKFKDLAQNKYSRFLVTKLIKSCTNKRADIFMEFRGSVLRLLLHREASSVLADAFELYANAYEKEVLVSDFYGKEVRLFGLAAGASGVDKERARKGLKGILEGEKEDRKLRILMEVKENLMAIFNNPDKGAVTHAIVHRALWEYISSVLDLPNEAERERLYREIFENCQDTLAEMVHTKDGSRVVREFLAQGSAKDRKQILKVIKPHIERMCLDDEAQLVLFTALDTIDDTKLLSKSLISVITSSLISPSAATVAAAGSNASTHFYSTPQGRRSIIYLLVPRTRRHFTPSQIALLSETDAARDRTSKKPSILREDEVRKAGSPDLVKWVEEKGGMAISDTGGCIMVVEIMLYADADKTTAIQSLLQPLCKSYPSSADDDPHPIDLPHTSRMYKTLLQGGHFNHTSHKIDYTSAWDPVKFAVGFVNTVGEEVMVGMCVDEQRGGAFVVAELCDTLALGSRRKQKEEEEASMMVVDEELEEKREEARKLVKGWFGNEVKEKIKQSEGMKGKKVLLDALARL
ncbi:hypothetical protein AMATHDRAFT_6504 [Amanita thiersii Skay4041]|uniref:PUM-HD domain-containing protein n=1 Tax=Amanita thiersii Skay4041 TaxID=703135 RepID=A0A2A9N9N8_9AGAR|nr:hypothetical protein AMATHDRAFT_6504 [Amanita thiersii Skay4041]